MGRFVTILLGALDPGRHVLSFANAGHGPAFHLRRETGDIRQLEPTCCPLGVEEREVRESSEPVALDPGDLVILATDGAIEQHNEDREMFGRRRLQQLVRDNQTLPAPRLLARLKEEISTFFRGSHPDDDVTILILERKYN